MKKSNNSPPLLYYLTALLLFGSNGVVASFIELPSYSIVLLRTLLGSGLLTFIFVFTGGRPTFYRYPKQFLSLCISGIAMGASWMLLYEAYGRIGVSIASLLYYCGPVIVMALSPLLFGERLTKLRLFGFAAVLAGVVLINGQTADNLDTAGILCGLGSAVMYAVMVIFNKKASTAIIGLENAATQLIIAFLTVAAYIGFRHGFTLSAASADWPPILMLGFVNTGIGCYLYFSSLRHLPVQTTAICGYLEPLSAVLLSVLFLHETMLPLQIMGGVLIIGGAVVSELSRRRNTTAD